MPAGIEHAVCSPRPFSLHSLYFPANAVRVSAEPQVLGLNSAAAFSTAFKQCFGVPPSHYGQGE